MRTDGGKGREGNGELSSSRPSVRPGSKSMEGGSDGGLFVGQVLEGRNPETEPNGAMHYRENLDVGFRVAGFRRIPSMNAITFINHT